MNADELKVGDEVLVFDVNWGRRGNAGGEPATVVKVGRKLVTLKIGTWWEKQFRLDTQRINYDYGHLWFRTKKQVAEDNRRREAVAALASFGLELSRRCSLTTDRLEAVLSALAGER